MQDLFRRTVGGPASFFPVILLWSTGGATPEVERQLLLDVPVRFRRGGMVPPGLAAIYGLRPVMRVLGAEGRTASLCPAQVGLKLTCGRKAREGGSKVAPDLT